MTTKGTGGVNMETFLDQFIIMSVKSYNETYLVEGILIKIDDNFAYIDRTMSGNVECAVGLSSIVFMELAGDDMIIKPEESSVRELDELIEAINSGEFDLKFPKLEEPKSETPDLSKIDDDDFEGGEQ